MIHKSLFSKVYILFLLGCLFCNLQLYSAGMDASVRRDGRFSFLQVDDSVIISIDIEIADTYKARKKGLMSRELSDFSSGMLFVFQDVKPRDFWMHNTPVSLDIIFIGEDFRIVNIARETMPMSDWLYSSKGPAKYVVEVKAGFAERYGIKEGTKIRWEKLSASE